MVETVQGDPCRKCGGTERYAKVPKGCRMGRCMSCHRQANREASRNRDREALRKAQRCWYQKNKERERDRTRKWHDENSERTRELNRRWYEENKERLLVRSRENGLRWARENPEKETARSQRRRARKLRAMPDWLTQEQHDEIASIYEEARQTSHETGVEHHVDHIVPLKGGNVRGLHVPWNLQILPAETNLKKGNRLQATPGLTKPASDAGLFEA